MFYRWLAYLLLGSLAAAQTATPSAPKAAKPAAKASASSTPAKAADPAVITISGICRQAPAVKTAECKTIVTQTEFESAVNAIQPNLPAAQRRQLAEKYGMAVALAEKAHTMGLDKGPAFEENLKLARLQVAARAAGEALQKKAMEVSDKDITDYYGKNTAAFEQVDLQRIFIPKTKKTDAPEEKSGADAAKQPAPQPESMEKTADEIHTRAAAGEDFAKLQTEALATAGNKAPAPSVTMGKVRRTMLPVTHASVFELKPGTVSSVISDQTGFFIYKVQSKETLPLDKVRDEIRSTLQNQQVRDSMGAIQQSLSFNDQYFKVPAAPQGVVAPLSGAPADK